MKGKTNMEIPPWREKPVLRWTDLPRDADSTLAIGENLCN